MSEYKRLTEKTIGCFEYTLKDHKPVVGEFGTYEAFFDYSMAVRQLGKYEDIGSPEEFAELAKAKADGRLAVLSTPMIPLVQSDDPMDSDVYCPACGNTLSGGWPDYHPDQEWTMYQCFHCGQSIDDTKVVTKEEAEQALKQIGGEV